jgi:hypothetical protein
MVEKAEGRSLADNISMVLIERGHNARVQI